MMTEPGVAARLFGPGLPGAGAAVRAHWRGEALLIEQSGAEPRRVALSAMSTVAAGFNASHRQLAWQGPEGRFALHLDEAAGEQLATTAPAAWRSSLDQARARQRRVERGFRWGWAALAGVMALPVVLAAAFFFNADRVADWVVDKIPASHEAKLGDMVISQTRMQNRLQDTGPVAEAVREIGQRLVRGSAYTYRWYVSDDKTINAFAAPGGVVVVNAGLIRAADSAEELAGVLAHEVSHAELRHGTKAMVKSLGLRALTALVIGDWSGSLAGDAATRLVEMKFSREAESEADREGLKRLVHAGISPQGMVKFFEKLGQSQGGFPAVLSTHPLPEARLAELQSLVAQQGSAQYKPLPLNWAKVKSQL